VGLDGLEKEGDRGEEQGEREGSKIGGIVLGYWGIRKTLLEYMYGRSIDR
jgi:hypothetical protein